MLFVINALLLLSGIVVTIAGIVMAASNAVNWLLAVFGIGLVLLAVYFDRQRVKQRDARVAEEIATRVSALTNRPWLEHEQFEVPQNLKQVFLVLFMLVVGSWAAWSGIHSTPLKWPLILCGIFFLGLVVLVLPASLAGIGKPALVLSCKGFRTPVEGLVEWRFVEGIYLQIVEMRGVKSYSLLFGVPDYANAVASIHWSQKYMAHFGLGGLRKGRIGVELKGAKEQPEAIEALARHLWKQATAREHLWNPNMSPQANEAMRRLAQFGHKYAASDQRLGALRTSPERVVSDYQQNLQDIALIKRETNKKIRLANWGLLVSIVGVVLAVAWPLLKRLL